MWVEILPAWIQAITLPAAGIWAAVTFRRQAKVRRAEWLQALYQQFFEEDRYKPIRRHLDYQTAELQGFIKACNEGRDCDAAFE